MRYFQGFLSVMFCALAAYTITAVSAQGWNLIAVFLADLTALGWRGQFNLDFMCYLLLSGLWIVWRHVFGATAYALALSACLFGFLFLAPYLLVLTIRTGGDMAAMLMGVHNWKNTDP